MCAKPLQPPEESGEPAVERRREKRLPGEGEVLLLLVEPASGEIHGRLVDLSMGGFRVAHTHQELCAGQKVKFYYASATGLARVAWNQVIGNQVESGLLVLSGQV